jgi:hypothetical protein
LGIHITGADAPKASVGFDRRIAQTRRVRVPWRQKSPHAHRDKRPGQKEDAAGNIPGGAFSFGCR